MIPVLTAEDVRRQDAEAAARGIPVERLMENAGWAVARAARRMLGGCYGRRVVVVCGKGNNAGDGLVAAGLLRDRGAGVAVVLVFPRQQLNELASLQLARFRGRVVGVDSLERELARADLVIDAIFGVGLTRAPEGAAAEAVAALDPHGPGRSVTRRAPVLSVDVPSGVDSDTGRVFDAVVRAHQTVTLSGLKPGLLFVPGREHAGEVEVADIGVPLEVSFETHPALAFEGRDVAGYLSYRRTGSHKRNVGTVLVVAGSRAMPGAAALVVGASVHAGAGLTVLCSAEDVCRIVLGRVPEITTIPVPETGEGTLDPKALDLIRPRLGEFDAVAIGPGLTTHPATIELVRALVGEVDAPVVIDADGISAFAGAPGLLQERFTALRGGPTFNRTVITPHAGELARLLGESVAAIEADRIEAARRGNMATRATVVLKGPGTVICDGKIMVNPTGGEALAQGGTGDVLTGLLASLCAQWARARGPTGAAHAKLIAAAVWLHGRAADRLAERLAPHPANASALIEELGPTIHEVCG